jgi:hypothetical protein
VIGLGYSESCARRKAVVGTLREIVTVGFNAISLRDCSWWFMYTIESILPFFAGDNVGVCYHVDMGKTCWKNGD